MPKRECIKFIILDGSLIISFLVVPELVITVECLLSPSAYCALGHGQLGVGKADGSDVLAERHGLLEQQNGGVVEEGTLLEARMTVDGHHGHFVRRKNLLVGSDGHFSHAHPQVGRVRSNNNQSVIVRLLLAFSALDCTVTSTVVIRSQVLTVTLKLL